MKLRRLPPGTDAAKIEIMKEFTNYFDKKVYTLCKFRWIWG